jgi:hypothetical protein
VFQNKKSPSALPLKSTVKSRSNGPGRVKAKCPTLKRKWFVTARRPGVLAGTGLDSRALAAEASGSPESTATERGRGAPARPHPPLSRRIPILISPDSPFPGQDAANADGFARRSRTATARLPHARGLGPTSDNRRSIGPCNSLVVLCRRGRLKNSVRPISVSRFCRSPEVSEASIIVLNQLLV